MGLSQKNEQLVPQCSFGFATYSLRLIDSCHVLRYRATVFAPLQTLPSLLSQLLCLLHCLQSPSSPSTAKVLAPMKKTEVHNISHRRGYQALRTYYLVTEVVNVTRLEHVLDCFFQLVLTAHIVRRVPRYEIHRLCYFIFCIRLMELLDVANVDVVK